MSKETESLAFDYRAWAEPTKYGALVARSLLSHVDGPRFPAAPGLPRETYTVVTSLAAGPAPWPTTVVAQLQSMYTGAPVDYTLAILKGEEPAQREATVRVTESEFGFIEALVANPPAPSPREIAAYRRYLRSTRTR